MLCNIIKGICTFWHTPSFYKISQRERLSSYHKHTFTAILMRLPWETHTCVLFWHNLLSVLEVPCLLSKLKSKRWSSQWDRGEISNGFRRFSHRLFLYPGFFPLDFPGALKGWYTVVYKELFFRSFVLYDRWWVAFACPVSFGAVSFSGAPMVWKPFFCLVSFRGQARVCRFCRVWMCSCWPGRVRGGPGGTDGGFPRIIY